MRDDRVRQQLVQTLTTLTPYPNPLATLYETLADETALQHAQGQQLTLAIIHQHRHLLQQQCDALTQEEKTIQRICNQCQQLSPTPLNQILLTF